MENNINKNEKKEDIGRYTKLQDDIGKQGWLFYDAPFKCARNIAKRTTGDKVLDLGGGCGTMAKVIEAITDKDVFVHNSNLYRTGIDSNDFDTVYTSHVLEHVDDPLKVVKESIRISKKRIIHVVPEGYTQDINLGSKHLYEFNRGSFMGLMAAAVEGMRNIEIAEFDIIQDLHINSLICVLLKA